MSIYVPRKSKEFIALLISYFERQRDNGGPLIPLIALREQVAEVLNISVRTVSSISQICRIGEPLRNPKKTRSRPKPVTDIDDFDKVATRITVYNIVKNKEYVNVVTLSQVLKEKDILHGSVTSLRTIIHNIGFDYKNDDPRRGLIELPIYVADQMALQHGHIVLRLSLYHCTFNPIEKLWGIAKQYYNKHIKEAGYGSDNCLQMWQKALGEVTAEMYANTVEDTNNQILDWCHRKVGFDRDDIAPLIINLADDSEDSVFEYEDD